MEMFREYIGQKWIPTGAVVHDQLEGVANYMFQTFMRQGTTEYSPMISLNHDMQAHLALGKPEFYLNKETPIPVSFIFGDRDFQDDITTQIVKINKYCGDDPQVQDDGYCGIEISKVHVIPSDHLMHMDNPDALASAIINDIYDAGL